MTRLRYLPEGHPAETGQWHPGWPASDHDEDDLDLALRKIASGLYTVESGEALATLRQALDALPDGTAEQAQAATQLFGTTEDRPGAGVAATPPEQPQNACATPVVASAEATPPTAAPESPRRRPGG